MMLLITRAFLLLFIYCFHNFSAAARQSEVSDTVYRSESLVITRLTTHAYVHTSYFQSESFGKVPCNGMLLAREGEAMVFDTPANDSSSAELISWVQSHLQCKIKAVVPTHFHEDCLGGLSIFHKQQIPSYAMYKTIALAKARKFPVPANGFRDSMQLNLTGWEVLALFPGEGHTRDNIVAYFPEEQVLFGGCLLKALNAGKGNLEDANVDKWSNSVEFLKQRFPHLKWVIPGHGDSGDHGLFDYTIQLFRKE
jgi:metallo-beta-lactamase class B